MDTDKLITHLRLILSHATAKPEVLTSPSGQRHVLTRGDYQLNPIGKPPRIARTRHDFADLASMASWLNRWADEQRTEILVSSAETTATLDPTDPHADHARCGMQLHPRGARWLNALTRRLSQRDFFELLVASTEDFEAADKDGKVTQADLLASQVAKLIVGRETSFESNLDERGDIRFTAASAKQTTDGKLPAQFAITVPWFLGVTKEEDGTPAPAEYTIDVRLSLDTLDETPRFSLKAPGLAVTEHEALDDAAAYLTRQLSEGFLVCRGTEGYETVSAGE